MTNRTYTDLFELIRALAGVDEFAPTESTKILAMVNRRLRQAYDASDVWPRYMRLDARPAPNGYVPYSYDAAAGTRMSSSVTRIGETVTFTTGGVDFDVIPGQKVVISGLSGTVNPNGTYTVSMVSGQSITFVIPSAQGNETYSGTGLCTPVQIPDVELFMRLHTANPTTSHNAWECDYFVDTDGAKPISSSAAYLGYFVTYKAVWEGPYTNASANIPQEWFFFAAHAAYADFLRMDGQVDKALGEEAAAQLYLETELSKASQQRNVVSLFRRFSTYASYQYR